MKRVFRILFSMLLVVLLPVGVASAGKATDTGTYRGFVYAITDGEVTITDYSGTATAKLTIPSAIRGYPVTAIGSKAFMGCTTATAIAIPGSVATIGDYAFYCCSNVTSVTIPRGVTAIGSHAFANCYNLMSVTVPDSVTVIGKSAFADCYSLSMMTLPYVGGTATENTHLSYLFGDTGIPQSLKTVVLSGSCKTVGENAFANCPHITTVKIGNGVTTVGKGAFQNCYSLSSITLGSKVRYVGDSTFEGCSALTGVVLPNSVLDIGRRAFYSCTCLTLVTIGKGVTTIGGDAFWGSNIRTATLATWAQHKALLPFLGSAKVTVQEVKLTSQPTSVAVAAGVKVNFKVKATGSGLKYRWQFRASSSAVWVNSTMIGNKTNTITVPATAARNGYQYRCIVTDAAGNQVISKIATLKALTPKITAHPKTVSVAQGSTVKFKVAATGLGLKYRWQFRTSSTAAWAHSTMTGNKTNVITIPATVARNGYQYRCVVTDTAGNRVISHVATLKAVSLQITTDPKTVSVARGSTAKFKVTATGVGLEYRWQFRSSSSSLWTNSTMVGSRTKTIIVPATAARNGYQYRCIITDAAGNSVISKIAKLSVK